MYCLVVWMQKKSQCSDYANVISPCDDMIRLHSKPQETFCSFWWIMVFSHSLVSYFILGSHHFNINIYPWVAVHSNAFLYHVCAVKQNFSKKKKKILFFYLINLGNIQADRKIR